jgi:hypothetical protein
VRIPTGGFLLAPRYYYRVVARTVPGVPPLTVVSRQIPCLAFHALPSVAPALIILCVRRPSGRPSYLVSQSNRRARNFPNGAVFSARIPLFFNPSDPSAHLKDTSPDTPTVWVPIPIRPSPVGLPSKPNPYSCSYLHVAARSEEGGNVPPIPVLCLCLPAVPSAALCLTRGRLLIHGARPVCCSTFAVR